MLPIGGAIIGGICGGPVGFLAGMKVGAAAAIGGGAIGFFSGRAIKKRQDKKIQMEMSVLTNGTLEGSVAESSKDKWKRWERPCWMSERKPHRVGEWSNPRHDQDAKKETMHAL